MEKELKNDFEKIVDTGLGTEEEKTMIVTEEG